MEAKRVKVDPIPPPPDRIEMNVSLDEAKFFRDILGRMTSNKECSVNHFEMYCALDEVVGSGGRKFKFDLSDYGAGNIAIDATDA